MVSKHTMVVECPSNVPVSPTTLADAYLVELSPDSDNPGYINASYVDVSGCLKAGLRVVSEG